MAECYLLLSVFVSSEKSKGNKECTKESNHNVYINSRALVIRMLALSIRHTFCNEGVVPIAC